jgi:hypothetical protein
MLSRPRSTICPLCGTQLGVTVENQWVPMALDEYREHARLCLIPGSIRTAAPESCIACGSDNQGLTADTRNRRYHMNEGHWGRER